MPPGRHLVILAYELVGAGPDLVLVPGTFSDRRTWLKLVGALSRRFRLLLLDPRGTGSTPDPGFDFSPDDLTGDLLETMDMAGVATCRLVGHSLGAQVALAAAARRPDQVSQVVAISPAFEIDPYLAVTLRLWMAMVDSDWPDQLVYSGLVLNAFGRRHVERLVPAVVQDLVRHPLSRDTIRRYIACDRRQDLRPLLERVSCPVLVVAGEEDTLTGVDQCRRLAAGLPGARLERLPACGHSPQVEAPAQLLRLLAGFLTT